MVKIDSRLATAVPVWLLAVTVIFLALRVGLTVAETVFPPVISAEIHWHGPEYVSQAKEIGQRQVLLYFDADWCEACRQVGKTTFLSRDVVGEINEKFVPVKVTDRKREDGKNTAEAQKLEDRYNIRAFPTFVLAMPDGDEVTTNLGPLDPRSMKGFLREGLAKYPFCQGREDILKGDDRGAALAFDEFLARTNWRHKLCSEAAVASCVSHRALGESEQAGRIVEDGLRKIKDRNFVYQILACLGGRLSFDDLLRAAREDRSNRLHCYAFTGMDCFAKKQYEEASKRLQWVVTNCDGKSCFHYRIAVAELERIRSRKLADGAGTGSK